MQEHKKIATLLEIQTYLDRLRYVVENETGQIQVIMHRRVDEDRDIRFTNRYTIAKLFPDEDPVIALTKALLALRPEDYIETVQDESFRHRPDFLVFGKTYADEDVYIKFRVEVVGMSDFPGGSKVLIMSFHFAEVQFSEDDFPFKEQG